MFIYALLINDSASFTNNFIVDYFFYKKVSSVVGFSCNIDKGNVVIY
jgi:hypothetical protein